MTAVYVARVRRKKIERACADLLRSMAFDRDPTLTTAEAEFYSLAQMRGKNTYRSGWPDFLVEHENGGWLGIEVKSDDDEIRPSQLRMFPALERAGIRIVIWQPSNPLALTPWRVWVDRVDRVKGTAKRGGSQRRPLRRVKTMR